MIVGVIVRQRGEYILKINLEDPYRRGGDRPVAPPIQALPLTTHHPASTASIEHRAGGTSRGYAALRLCGRGGGTSFGRGKLRTRRVGAGRGMQRLGDGSGESNSLSALSDALENGSELLHFRD